MRIFAGLTGPFSALQLVPLCKSSKGKQSVDLDGFVTVLRTKKSKSSESTSGGVPCEEDFPALESPPKSGGQIKKGKERKAKEAALDKQSKAQSSDPKSEEGKKSLLLPEVTAEFDGLMSELLTGLRLQGPQSSPSDSLQTGGPVDTKLAPKEDTAKGQEPSDSTARIATQRVLFPENTSPHLSACGSSTTAQRIEAKTQAAPPLPYELSFFAVPPRTPKLGAPKTPNPYSPKSVLDLSSPVGSPAANQTPPAGAKRSPYRPTMIADPAEYTHVVSLTPRSGQSLHLTIVHTNLEMDSHMACINWF